MAKPKSPTPESIADTFTARERVIVFCAAMDIDHAAVGILASAMQVMEVRGLIERDHSTSRYVVTDMLTVRMQAIDGTGTFTLSDSQSCRLLLSRQRFSSHDTPLPSIGSQ
jgi:hypothetical protein